MRYLSFSSGDIGCVFVLFLFVSPRAFEKKNFFENSYCVYAVIMEAE